MCKLVNLCIVFTILMQTHALQISQYSYLPSAAVDLYQHSLKFIEDAACQRDLNATLWGLLNGQQWAQASKCGFYYLLFV